MVLKEKYDLIVVGELRETYLTYPGIKDIIGTQN